jgi:hypothetical protein
LTQRGRRTGAQINEWWIFLIAEPDLASIEPLRIAWGKALMRMRCPNFWLSISFVALAAQREGSLTQAPTLLLALTRTAAAKKPLEKTTSTRRSIARRLAFYATTYFDGPQIIRRGSRLPCSRNSTI